MKERNAVFLHSFLFGLMVKYAQSMIPFGKQEKARIRKGLRT